MAASASAVQSLVGKSVASAMSGAHSALPSVASFVDPTRIGHGVAGIGWPALLFPALLLLLLAFVARELAPRIGLRRPPNPHALRHSGVHLWEAATTPSAAGFCNVCEKVCVGLADAVVRCSLCGMLAHQACSTSAAHNCKPLALLPVTPSAGLEETESRAKAAAGSGTGAVPARRPRSDTEPAVADPALEAATITHTHHWVRGNLREGTVCSVCSGVCASSYALKGARCQWCWRAAHEECITELPSQCDLGELAPLIVPPAYFSTTPPGGQSLTGGSPQRRGSSSHGARSAALTADIQGTGAGAGAGGGAGSVAAGAGAGAGTVASAGAQQAGGSDSANQGGSTGDDTGDQVPIETKRSRVRRVVRRLRAGLKDMRASMAHRGWRSMLAELPSDVNTLSRSALRRVWGKIRRWDAEHRASHEAVRFWCVGLPENVTPVVVLVNRGSGGRMGGALLAMFRRLLNPLQVGDLADGGPRATLQRFASCPRLRILCCGGDGTVGWVMSAIDELDMACTPAIAIMPLGTGNDFARAMRWGGGASGAVTKRMARRWLLGVADAHVSMLDRWQVRIVPTSGSPDPADASGTDGDGDDSGREATRQRGRSNSGGSARGRPRPSRGQGQARRRRCARRPKPQVKVATGASASKHTVVAAPGEAKVMNIYMGIGVGAQVALQFHKLRKSFPRLFCSRLGNKVWYSQVGGLEIVRNTCRTMWQKTHLVCDGVHVPLPPGTQGIIVLNIGSYGGGADLWGPSDDDSVASRVARSPHGATTPVLGTAPSRAAGSAGAASGSAAAGAAVTSVGAERLPITDDFVVPSPHDGLLEIVAVTGSLHLAQTQVGLANARRLVQCRSFTVTTSAPLPMQIDGEPVLQPPSTISVGLLNQAVVLRRSVQRSGLVASRLVEVLDWGQATGVITAEQRTVLLRELAERSQGIAT